MRKVKALSIHTTYFFYITGSSTSSALQEKKIQIAASSEEDWSYNTAGTHLVSECSNGHVGPLGDVEQLPCTWLGHTPSKYRPQLHGRVGVSSVSLLFFL